MAVRPAVRLKKSPALERLAQPGAVDVNAAGLDAADGVLRRLKWERRAQRALAFRVGATPASPSRIALTRTPSCIGQLSDSRARSCLPDGRPSPIRARSCTKDGRPSRGRARPCMAVVLLAQVRPQMCTEDGRASRGRARLCTPDCASADASTRLCTPDFQLKTLRAQMCKQIFRRLSALAGDFSVDILCTVGRFRICRAIS